MNRPALVLMLRGFVIYDLVWDEENLFYEQIIPESYGESLEFPEEDLKE